MPETMSASELAVARRLELERLVEAHGGVIDPAHIVEAARFPASALHSLFTWDDDEAAEKWRLVEAQKYLRAQVTILRTTGPTETVQVRAFVSLPSDRAEGIYRPMVTVLNSEEMMAELMQDARREFLTFRRKYGHLERLRGPLAQLEQALAA